MARAHAQTRTPKVPVRDQTRIQGEAQPRKKRPRRFYDYSLLFTIIFLTVFGLIMIYSSSSYNAQVNGQSPSYYMVRQAQIAFAGFVDDAGRSPKMNYHFFARFTIPAIVVSYVCMLLVNFYQPGHRGQRKEAVAGNPVAADPAGGAGQGYGDPGFGGDHYQAGEKDQ